VACVSWGRERQAQWRACLSLWYERSSPCLEAALWPSVGGGYAVGSSPSGLPWVA
jgi:hypothetical protein